MPSEKDLNPHKDDFVKEFDRQLQGVVNNDRAAIYGHPADHFTKSALLKEILFDNWKGGLPYRHTMEMIVDKLVRLSKSPQHLDSWIDVAGYARTAVMVMDRNSGDQADVWDDDLLRAQANQWNDEEIAKALMENKEPMEINKVPYTPGPRQAEAEYPSQDSGIEDPLGR